MFKISKRFDNFEKCPYMEVDVIYFKNFHFDVSFAKNNSFRLFLV